MTTKSRYFVQRSSNRRNWDVIDRTTGDVEEGGFFNKAYADRACLVLNENASANEA